MLNRLQLLVGKKKEKITAITMIIYATKGKLVIPLQHLQTPPKASKRNRSKPAPYPSILFGKPRSEKVLSSKKFQTQTLTFPFKTLIRLESSSTIDPDREILTQLWGISISHS